MAIKIPVDLRDYVLTSVEHQFLLLRIELSENAGNPFEMIEIGTTVVFIARIQ